MPHLKIAGELGGDNLKNAEMSSFTPTYIYFICELFENGTKFENWIIYAVKLFSAI